MDRNPEWQFDPQATNAILGTGNWGREVSGAVMNDISGKTERPTNDIPVLILNWNGEADTIECLKSIQASTPAGFVPVLVDNGSQAQSIEILKRECGLIFPGILFIKRSELSSFVDSGRAKLLATLEKSSLVFIENGENLGFAKGNNVGIEFAKLVGAEWVMLLNNDTVVTPELFRELRSFLGTHPHFTAITPQVRYHVPHTRIQNCGGDLTYFGSRRYKFANMEASMLPESDFSVITFVTGCALLFKHDVLGALSEDFFFGEEDYEFSLRMKRLGLGMACVHKAVVYHKVGASISKSSKPLGAILVQYVSRLMNTRNYYSRIRWHATRILAYLYLPILLRRNGIAFGRTMEAIQRVDSYIKRHQSLDRADFRAMINLQ